MGETWLGRGDYCIRQLPLTSVDIRDVFGTKMTDGKLLGERQRNSLNGRNYGGSAIIESVSLRGHPWLVQAEDGRCGIIGNKSQQFP